MNTPPPGEADPARGLEPAEATARLLRVGPNQLPEPDRRNLRRILVGVLREPMLLLLFGASAVYFLLGERGDALALLASIVAVATLSIIQEMRAEHALRALRDLASPRARVLRGGAVHVVPGSEIVPGDILLVGEGDRVPADARLLEGDGVLVDESLLTGESVPLPRMANDAADGAAPTAGEPADATDLLHAGTLLVRGRGSARVVATGVDTAIGRIGVSMVGLRATSTPLQRDMRRVVLAFAALSLLASGLVVFLHWRTHGALLPALLAGITLAIATIPEEFPIMIAIFLALGAWRMSRHQAVVRRAAAIETLGAVTVLCTDKTGTLTENRMRVVALAPAAPGADAEAALRDTGAQACDSQPHDPMEIAFLAAADGALPAARGWQRVRTYPVGPGLPLVAHVWRSAPGAPLRVACKGAPETIATLCGLSPSTHAAVLAEAAAMGARGLRVLAVADGEAPDAADALPPTAAGFALQWRGLAGLADPLRQGAAAAVAEARGAGIRVLMLTGDHQATAGAIAREAGIDIGDAVLTGAALEVLDDGALRAALLRSGVVARVAPAQKLRIVQALRAGGDVVGMTGDGVNDAPALMAADVGVAMGGRGTDVAREAAAIVLLDDEFGTIVQAVRMGRAIYDNLARAVRYVLAVHVPIVGLALLPLLVGAPPVLLPLHVVFIELIIDPASTLVFEGETPDPGLMRRPPRAADARLVDFAALRTGLGAGVIAFACVFAVWWLARAQALPTAEVGALCFIALVAGNLALIGAMRPAQARGGNRAMRWLLALVLPALALCTLLPGPARAFGFAPPPLAMALGAALLPWAVFAAGARVARVAARRTARTPGVAAT